MFNTGLQKSASQYGLLVLHQIATLFATMVITSTSQSEEMFSQPRRLGDHPNSANGVSFSNDGQRMLSVGGKFVGLLQEARPGEALVWDWRRGERIATITGHKDGISCGGFLASGKTAITGGFDSRVAIWSGPTFDDCKIISEGQLTVTSLASSFDGAIIAVGGGRKLATVQQNGDEGVVLLAKSMNGKWEALHTHSDTVRSIALSPDNKRLGSLDIDGLLKVSEISSKREVYRSNGDDMGNVVRWLSNDIVVIGRGGPALDKGSLEAHNCVEKRRLWRTEFDRAVFASTVVRRHSLVCIGLQNGDIELVDATSGKSNERRHVERSRVTGLDVSPNEDAIGVSMGSGAVFVVGIK